MDKKDAARAGYGIGLERAREIMERASGEAGTEDVVAWWEELMRQEQEGSDYLPLLDLEKELEG